VKRFKIKEIHSWLNQLPENKWRKIYKVDAKRVAYFVNHGSNATLPVTLSRKFGDTSFLRELQLAKNFVLHKIDEKRKLEGKSNNPITEDVEMHTISGNKRFMTKTALPILKKHGIKNVKVNDVAGDFLEIRFLVDINKLKVIDKELTRKNRTAYGGIVETFNKKLLKVIYEEIIKLDRRGILKEKLSQESRELRLFIDNDARLYKSRYIPILKNLSKFKKKGKYNSKLAIKAFMYLIDDGAKVYAKDYADGDASIFSKKDRLQLAKDYAEEFESQYNNQEFDFMK
jgi:hypothetical protein|tara:strand:- start:3802 stop:4659 length:858 start_codon:yes stop_codon:yes gene_type:complete